MKVPKKMFTLFGIIVVALLLKPTNAFASEPISSWHQQTPLPYPVASHTSLFVDNKLTVVGGATDFSISNITQTEVNNAGELVLWQTNQYLPTPLFWNAVAKKDNFTYLLGGSIYTGTHPTNLVYLSNNNLQTWSTTTPFPYASALGNSVIVNNKIYYSGGGLDSNFNSITSNVYVANINSDGSLGNWISTTPLPEPMFGHGMIETGSKIIVIGGRTSTWLSSPRIYETTINSDGSLGNWTQINSLPIPISRAGIIKRGNTVFVVGGENLQGVGNVTNLDSVYYAKIDSNGSIGPWSQSQNKLPKPTGAGSLAASNTHIFYTGGYNTNYTSDVWMAEILPDINYPSLNVPDLKQYSFPWNTQIYDNATAWSSNPTIERWGCALTSAAMVLKYFNHNIDPGTLNTWLNTQKDGYIRNGLLNWLAVSRYTIQHKSANSPTLEYKRLAGNDLNLISELQAGRPSILEEPGHFVVAKNQLPSTFGINDPAYPERTTLQSYNSSFNSIGSYRPTQTDLSYIMLVTNENVNIKITNPSGNSLEGYSYLTNPLIDDVSGEKTSGSALKVFAYPKPELGNYFVEIVSNSSSAYKLDTYLYNKDGDVKMLTFLGLLPLGGKDNYQIAIGSQMGIEKQKITTFNTLIDDLKTSYNLNLISKSQIYNLLDKHLQLAKYSFDKNKVGQANGLLSAFNSNLSDFTPTFVDKETSQFLQSEASFLKQILSYKQ